MKSQTTDISRNFIHKMTKEEKIAFLKAFTCLANSDGHFDKEEKEFIGEIAYLYGLDKKARDEIMKENDAEEVIREVSKIKNRRAELELIKEMCMLAHANGVFSDEETLFIGRVGKAMGVEPEKVAQISRWVIDRLIWLEEAKLIFEEK